MDVFTKLLKLEHILLKRNVTNRFCKTFFKAVTHGITKNDI